MPRQNVRQPFISITIFGVLLMATLLYMQQRVDKSIKSIQDASQMSLLTFRVNDHLTDLINSISEIENGIRTDISTGRIIPESLKDSANMLVEKTKLILGRSKEPGNQTVLNHLYNTVMSKKILYDSIAQQPLNKGIAKQALRSDYNNSLNENIYLDAQKIQIELEDELLVLTEESTLASARVLLLNRVFTMLAIIGIIVLATLIIRHLKNNMNLIEVLDHERQKTQHAANIKEQFLANMSHEIRTPVNAISGFTNLLQKSSLDSKQQEFVRIIKTASSDLHNIVNDILDISKIEAGMLHVNSSPFSVKELLYDLEMLYAHSAMQKGIRLDVKIADGVPGQIAGDEQKLRQILTNLISNAIKFTNVGGVKVTLNCSHISAKEIECCFTISDTGIGIPLNKQGSIFERFEQADLETTRKFGGTGLGLAIVKDLVNMQRGHINLQSTPGAGTSFVVIIPYNIVESAEIVPSKMVEPVNPGIFTGTARILAAEDNVMNQLLLKHMLKQYNLDVTIVANGQAAVNILKSESFDLVLMDIQMPQLNGYETVNLIRNKLELKIPVVAMTAHVLPGEEEKCFNAGMNDYISKPLSEDSLLRILTKYNLVRKHSPQTLVPLIDFPALKATYAGDEDFVLRMVNQFILQFADEVKNLCLQIEQSNFKPASAIAHSMRSTIATINNRSSLLQVVMNIEKACAVQDQQIAMNLAVELKESLQKIKKEIIMHKEIKSV